MGVLPSRISHLIGLNIDFSTNYILTVINLRQRQHQLGFFILKLLQS